jgi:pimeloyl-ACP methyl ester carboxylesterase
MSNLRQVILVDLAILIVLVAVACGAGSLPVMPTPKNVPLPPTTSTPENAPLPSATPRREAMQIPELPAPEMKGVVEVSGYSLKLSYQCYGEGTPTIIVEAAAYDKPVSSRSWNPVIQGVYPTTRICIYNRLLVHAVQDGAENLHLLLTAVPLPGPYIIVAHSLGGWYARVFAHLYPNDVAGMILVDTTPTFPDPLNLYATAYPTYSPDESAFITKNRTSEADIVAMIPPPSLEGMEGLDMRASSEQVRHAGSFGDLPLIVIAHTTGPEDLRDVDPAAQEQFAAMLLKVRSDLATLSSRGIFMQAATTKHFISEYEPQFIIDAILRMVEEIRIK